MSLNASTRNYTVFFKSMKILGVIPARYGSSRFPGNHWWIILGKPMIQRVYEQAKKMPSPRWSDRCNWWWKDRRLYPILSRERNAYAGNEQRNRKMYAVVKQFSPGEQHLMWWSTSGGWTLHWPATDLAACGCFLSEEVVIDTLVKKITQPDGPDQPNVVKLFLT